MGQSPRLSRPRTGEDQKRTVTMQDSPPLLVVQRGKQITHATPQPPMQKEMLRLPRAAIDRKGFEEELFRNL
jgi:hypothetical protein